MRGEQWEAGLRYEPPSGNWRSHIAVYELREKNRTVEISPTEVVQTGQTRNTGLELEWIGQITPEFTVNANYALTCVDRQLTGTPEHRAAVWGTYRFRIGNLSGFSAGAGLQYQGDFQASEGTPTTPSSLILDAMLAWQNDEWRVALNMNNVTDEVYFSNCYSWGACSYAPERNVILRVTRRF